MSSSSALRGGGYFGFDAQREGSAACMYSVRRGPLMSVDGHSRQVE